jgi:RNA polymerase sigma-70 factor, ECF subfamily
MSVHVLHAGRDILGALAAMAGVRACVLAMHTISATPTVLNRVIMPEPAHVALEQTRFEDLYRREYPGLVAVATALSGHDGEDLVHDAMVKALMNWNHVRQLERPGGWCHRVLVNICRSRWRRRMTEARFVSRQRREEPATPGPSPEVLAFWGAVRELPTRPRLAVTLYYAGDHTTAEVATILDVPEGTVRSDLTRARLALARELEV